MNFEEFPKIPRLNREVIVTEKIDGTNASIFIQRRELVDPKVLDEGSAPFLSCEFDGNSYVMLAGSRTRWVSVGNDNFGFGAWVSNNRDELIKLGEGHHFGEWWGKGIQRGYGLDEKRFSLFNATRWGESRPACCHVVPVLATGYTDMNAATLNAIDLLKEYGSVAAPGFMKPEGVIAYHTAAKSYFKVTCEKDNEWKGKAA